MDQFLCPDEQIDKFEKKDEIALTLGELADAIDAAYKANGFFKDLKQRAWNALNSYTHTGLLQLGRRFTGHQLKPAYSEEEIFEITTASTTCVLTLIRAFFGVQNHADELKRTEELIESYGNVARQTRTQANL